MASLKKILNALAFLIIDCFSAGGFLLILVNWSCHRRRQPQLLSRRRQPRCQRQRRHRHRFPLKGNALKMLVAWQNLFGQ